MEFKEVVKKNGKVIVFCNLEDFVKEFYQVKTIEETKPFIDSNGEYQCHCPFCKAEGHTKHKLYIKEDFSVGHCFVCTRAFINVTDTIKTELNVPRVYSKFHYSQPEFKLPEMKDPEWTLDKFKYEFDDFDEVGYKYLMSRHKYFKDLYKILGFKFWSGNVVMPFMHNGEPFYYQIRFSGKSSIRYYLPPVSEKAAYIIERNIEEDSRHRILIVEGIFDAVAALIQAPDYTPVAVLGSSISNYQISQIREYAGYISEVRIWMDETKISARIRSSIRGIIDYCPISIIKSDGPDPEEILKSRISKGKKIQWIKSKYVSPIN